MGDENRRQATVGSTSEWAPYIRAWRKRARDEQRKRIVAAQAAREAARTAAAALVEKFGCERVYLFGSLTGRGATRFGPHSDVDLAVEGLRVEQYLSALAMLENAFRPGVSFDLIRVEDALPSLVAQVQLTGEVLADGAAFRGAGCRSG